MHAESVTRWVRMSSLHVLECALFRCDVKGKFDRKCLCVQETHQEMIDLNVTLPYTLCFILLIFHPQ